MSNKERAEMNNQYGLKTTNSIEDEINNNPYTNKILIKNWESGLRVGYKIKGKVLYD